MKTPRKTANADSASHDAALRTDDEIGAALERLEAIGRQVRSDIVAVREAIQAEQGRLEKLHRAPASEQEIDARIDKLIAEGAASVRRGNFFGMLAAREGQYSDNDIAVGFDRVDSFDLWAAIASDVLRAGLKQEAMREAEAAGVPALSAAHRADAIASSNSRILGLMAKEEACCRSLNRAGLKVERRIETPQRIRDASADELNLIAGEA